MGKKEEIAAVITPALEALGFYLEDINITSALESAACLR